MPSLLRVLPVRIAVQKLAYTLLNSALHAHLRVLKSSYDSLPTFILRMVVGVT